MKRNKEKIKINNAMIISLVVLLFYTYFAFLGLVYWKNGEILEPILLSLLFIVVVFGIVLFMCMTKASRCFKTPVVMALHILAIVILATLFGLSAIVFTNFLNVVSNKSKIYTEITSTMQAGKDLSIAYNTYVDERIERAKVSLNNIAKSQKTDHQMYNETFSKIPGATMDKKIDNIIKSLKRQLLPEEIISAQKSRNEYLTKASNLSIYNVMLPKIINQVNKNVSNWTKDYVEVSSKIHGFEYIEPFEYKDFSSQLEQTTAFYTKLHKPNIMSVVFALLGLILILLPYIITNTSIASNGDTNDDVK